MLLLMIFALAPAIFECFTLKDYKLHMKLFSLMELIAERKILDVFTAFLVS